MTVQQMKIAVMTATQGTISAAARELGIPQPNASSGIRALESELGFQIFTRTVSGISLTEKGVFFIEHAKKIIEESDRISLLTDIDRICRLRVGCTNYFRGKDAFVRFCNEHRDDELATLSYYNVSIENGIGLLAEYKLDIVVAITVDSLFPTTREMAAERNLDCIELGDATPMLTLRKDHPLIADGMDTEDAAIYDRLKDYPYVAYQNLTADFEAPYYRAVFKVPCKYTIYVDDKETRMSIVGNSNAFQLGSPHAKDSLDFYGLTEYPLPVYRLKVFCIFRKEDIARPEFKRFLEILQEDCP